MIKPLRNILLCIASLIGATGALSGIAEATPVRDGNVVAELIARDKSVIPGQPLLLGVHLKMNPGWHTYWRNPGDSGIATTIAWKLPDGYKAGPIDWPAPQRLSLASIVNYGYEGDVLLASRIDPGKTKASSASFHARVDWLVCSAEECIPGGADLDLTLPVSSGMAAIEPANAALFQQAQERMPRQSVRWILHAEPNGTTGYRLIARPNGDGGKIPDSLYFFAADSGTVEPSAAQPVTAADGSFSVTLKRSQYSDGSTKMLRGVWMSKAADGWGDGITALAVDAPLEPAGSGKAVPSEASASIGLLALAGMAFTAFLGGMILNLMPCVFPVLSIKILGFVQNAGEDRGKIALHGWIYTLGVLTSFWILAGSLLVLRAGGSQLAWGYQLQSPLFVILLCMLLFMLAFSLLGVFEIGAGVVGAAGKVRTGNGHGGSFLSGVLATLLATPCTAPFMGTALAFALTQPAPIALAVFTALALGMAAPYLILSLRPQWLKFLPRPGVWMDSLKQAMAFPLIGTIIWLLWVFGLQTGMDGMLNALLALLGLSVALWLWGRWGALYREPKVRKRAAVAALAISAAALFFGWSGSSMVPDQTAVAATGSQGQPVWESYTPERVAALRAQGRPVFVDFGAAWCATCIVNERMVLNTDEVQKAFAGKNVALIKADWTRRDPVITRALAGFGKSGVPFHVLYGAGDGQPLLTRDLVGKAELIDAIGQLPKPQ
ncbi:protein-disulfide reductase DsbD family protein [Sphingobium sp.]|uniref:protein-disulfide reductase DsbD family protein n=1 Tax=Sphingobium sp. TaxID=1912891 RepID=UPI0028BD2D05|nr:thioredoxin family protein [Sphingobium sp.]